MLCESSTPMWCYVRDCQSFSFPYPARLDLKRCMVDRRRNPTRTITQNAVAFLPFLVCIGSILVVLGNTFAARLNTSWTDTPPPISWGFDFACTADNW